jgi:co-chaperonin GroES (HSP10)
MRISLINPKQGYIVVKRVPVEERTESGLVLTENDDDFVCYGLVVRAPEGSAWKEGVQVMFHILDGQSFKALDSADSTQNYVILKEDSVLGTYARE